MNEACVSSLGFSPLETTGASTVFSLPFYFSLLSLFSNTQTFTDKCILHADPVHLRLLLLKHTQSDFHLLKLKLSRYSCVNCPFSNSVILDSNLMQSPLPINLPLLHSCFIFLSPLSFTHNSLKFRNTKTATRAVFVSSPHIKSRN